MTYQVSYCIYTAATVEAQELKSPSLTAEEREEAASRLTAAVTILQNEASHTPGSGKSLDTIRRLLSEGQRPKMKSQRQGGRRRKRMRMDVDRRGETVQRGTEGPTDDESHGDSAMGNDSAGGERPRSSLDVLLHPENGNDSNGMNSLNQAQMTGSGEARQMNVMEQSEEAQGVAEAAPSGSQQQSFVQQGFAGGAGPLEGWEGDLGFYGGTDTGAGFHPDAFSWGITEDFPRIPAPPPQPASASASATVSYPVWSNQGWFMPGS